MLPVEGNLSRGRSRAYAGNWRAAIFHRVTGDIGVVREGALLMGPMSIKARAADAVAASALGVGLVLSRITADWDWFARSGSAVVIIGILLTSSQIREHMKRLRALRGQLMAQSQRDWASDDDKRALLRAASIQESIWEGEGHGLYMLIAGTLIWGFGDLLGLVFG